MPNLFQRRLLGALNLAAKYPTLSGPGRLSYGHIYAGTVPADEVARRRKANKVARASRRQNRKAA